MNTKKDFSLLNCISTGLLAYFFTIPVHEMFHALTLLAYGDGVLCYSASAVEDMKLVDFSTLSPFDRIMLGGGSASILNAIIGFVLFLIVLKVKMGPTVRVFMVQLTGTHLSCGIGYFMIGGLFGAGDWGIVFDHLADMPELITALRVVLSIIGCGGVVLIFFMLNYMSYYFIDDKAGKKEKIAVAAKLHLIMLIFGYGIGMIVTVLSPANESGALSLGLGALYNMMFVPFFWGFMFTGVMNVLPPKKSRFLYKLPAKPNWILFLVAVALILVDIIVLGPGIWFV
jgi:hypothetical protein